MRECFPQTPFGSIYLMKINKGRSKMTSLFIFVELRGI
jgi:hypothetical protein